MLQKQVYIQAALTVFSFKVRLRIEVDIVKFLIKIFDQNLISANILEYFRTGGHKEFVAYRYTLEISEWNGVLSA